MLLSSTAAFNNAAWGGLSIAQTSKSLKIPRGSALMDQKGNVSKSGNKRDRLNRLADLEEERIETDKGFVVKAAGAFVGLLVILLAVAFSTLEGPI